MKKYDYTGFVGANCNVLTQLEPGNNIKWSQFLELYEKERENLVLIDVRSEAQFAIIHLPPFKNVLLEELRKKEGKFFAEFDDKEKKIFVMCRRGNNSKIAVKLLLSQQYKSIIYFKPTLIKFNNFFCYKRCI